MKEEELIENGFACKLITKTPSGGDYVIKIFLDENLTPTTEDKAYRIDVLEKTNDGKTVGRTILVRTQENSQKNK